MSYLVLKLLPLSLHPLADCRIDESSNSVSSDPIRFIDVDEHMVLGLYT